MDDQGKLLAPLPAPPTLPRPAPLQSWQGLKVGAEILNVLEPDMRHQEKTPLARGVVWGGFDLGFLTVSS